ncbi:hypothetical protein Gbth_051_059 [Gluconobacter thailandicus F149-1 = NBRC 100600]|nr:hypothetical protein Gbth_051_059 [Gluconobacter thailandicus F149-1 = NBRC 100600]GBR57721.1 hypothetical protein AA100600_0403 [Gluconobacter thailandicus F149-1 = NBRC 100600]
MQIANASVRGNDPDEGTEPEFGLNETSESEADALGKRNAQNERRPLPYWKMAVFPENFQD